MSKSWIAWALVLAALGAPAAGAETDKGKSDRTIVEQGRLVIYFQGQESGFEKYTIFKLDSGKFLMETESELALPRGAGNTLFRYRTSETMDDNYNPLLYNDTFYVNERESYIHVTFQDGKSSDNAVMGGQTLSRTARVSPQFRVLEEAVYSLYSVLYKKFKLNKAEKQSIPVYIPKIAVEVIAKVNYNGETMLQTPLGEVKLLRYFIDLGGFQGATMDVSEKGQLMRLNIPRQDIELVRDLAYDMKQGTAPPAGK
jgi:hypothetical protein